MGIARSLRQANYLRPVSGAIHNYLALLDKKRKEEEFNTMVQAATGDIESTSNVSQRSISRLPMGSGDTTLPSRTVYKDETPNMDETYKQIRQMMDSGTSIDDVKLDPTKRVRTEEKLPLGIPKPATNRGGFRDVEPMTIGMSDNDKKRSYEATLANFGLDTLEYEGREKAQTALSQLVKSKLPEEEEVVMPTYREFDKNLYEETPEGLRLAKEGKLPAEEKEGSWYKGEKTQKGQRWYRRLAEDGKNIEVKHTSEKWSPNQWRLGGSGTKKKTPKEVSFENLEKAILGHNEIIAGAGEFSEYSGSAFHKKGKAIEENALISTIESSYQGMRTLAERVLRENKLKPYAKKYDDYIKGGGDKEDILHSIKTDPNLNEDQRRALELYYQIPNE